MEYSVWQKGLVRIIKEINNPMSMLTMLKHFNNEQMNSGQKYSLLNRPIYVWESRANWGHVASVVCERIPRYGIYLCAFQWSLFRTDYHYLDNGNNISYEDHSILCLHGVCKEPQMRFNGKIGPINTFVPHYNHWKNCQYNGIWLAMVPDERLLVSDYFIQTMNNVNNIRYSYNEHHFRSLKLDNPNLNQIMFFISHESAMVVFQSIHTYQEEQEIRRKIGWKNYHHQRPIIMENGFYLAEGKFNTNFLNYSRIRPEWIDITPDTFQTKMDKPKMLIINEGTHFLRITTEDNYSGSTKLRKIEVCLDFNYKNLILFDVNDDFKFIK